MKEKRVKVSYVSDSFMDKTQNMIYIFLNLMELTVANDFQNNIYQATINSILSNLADRNGTEYLLKGKKGK